MRLEVHDAASEQLHCHRCNGPAALAVRVPQPGWNSEPTPPPDRHHRWVHLCIRCDHDRPETQGLLAFLALHQHINPDQANEFRALVTEWVSQLADTPHTVDSATFDAEIDAFNRGELE